MASDFDPLEDIEPELDDEGFEAAVPDDAGGLFDQEPLIGPLEWIVGTEHEGIRLDRVVAMLAPKFSRSVIQRDIEAGAVTLDGDLPKRGTKTLVWANARIRYAPPPRRRVTLQPEDGPLTIIYEDDHMLVIDKPAGIIVHPGAGHPSGTILNRLIGKYRLARGAGAIRPGVVHRIDKNTTGLLMFAKTDEAYAGLRRSFELRTIEKTYLAVVLGLPQPREARIETLFGRHPHDRKRFSSRVRTGKRASTRYFVVRTFAGASLVEVHLETGRTHQIRVHFADRGHPLVGDVEYGAAGKLPRDPKARAKLEGFARPALHARRLELEHPVTSQPLVFEAPVPADLQELVQSLEGG